MVKRIEDLFDLPEDPEVSLFDDPLNDEENLEEFDEEEFEVEIPEYTDDEVEYWDEVSKPKFDILEEDIDELDI